jgi:hypothetical protein
LAVTADHVAVNLWRWRNIDYESIHLQSLSLLTLAIYG